MSTPHNTSPLISAVELNGMLNQDSIKIFDVRGRWGTPATSSLDDYIAGHIPGAVFLDWTEHFLAPDLPINLAPVANEYYAQEAFTVLGISPGDSVVLYDDYHHMFAGRLWWAMRYWGFKHVRVLNGGWNHWRAKGLPISTSTVTIDAGHFVVDEQAYLTVGIDAVKHRSGDTVLFDARGPINYQGDPANHRSGHIPGAVNLPYASLLDTQTGLFKSPELLTTLFRRQVKNLDEVDIISSCGSGYAGTVLLLALKYIGIDAALFDGSFAIWKENKSLPIEQGPGKV